MWLPRLPSVACRIAFSRANSIHSPSGMPRSVAMIFKRVCWWMTSSAWIISDPPEPESRQDQRGTADAGHPQEEVRLQRHEPDQREDRDRDAGRDISRAQKD